MNLKLSEGDALAVGDSPLICSFLKLKQSLLQIKLCETNGVNRRFLISWNLRENERRE